MPGGAVGPLGHAGIRQQLLGEVDMFLGHHLPELLLQLLGAHIAHALVFLRNDDIDAVGLVADVLVDPVEFFLQLLGGKAHRAQHADAAGLAHRHHHVAAVGEGEDRVVDAEFSHSGLVMVLISCSTTPVSSAAGACGNVLPGQAMAVLRDQRRDSRAADITICSLGICQSRGDCLVSGRPD